MIRKWIVCSPLIFTACSSFERSIDSGYAPNTHKDSHTKSSTSNSIVYRDVRYSGKTKYSSVDNMGDDDSQMSNLKKKQKVRELERKLDTRKEREQYSKILPWLKSDEEKIEFLSLDSIDTRQAWINKNQIWNRANLRSAELKELVDSQDIAVGMPQEYVKKSWGEPISVEASGNPIYRNERWKYSKYIPTPEGHRVEKRWVYFEGGRVVGWETE